LKTNDQIIGTVDLSSAYWMVHPEAIYFHGGKTYRVDQLDLDQQTATLVEVSEDYFTEPKKKTEIQQKSVIDEKWIKECQAGFGELLVSNQVTGYKRVKFFTNEPLDTFPLEMPVVDLQTTGCWIGVPENVVEQLREAGEWLNDPNDYGPFWTQIRNTVRQRDEYRCRNCGIKEGAQPHHVHHKTPFRAFQDKQEANRLENLITLCPTCHHIAEANVRMQSGLAGLSYTLRNLAPFFLMCDYADIEAVSLQQADSHTGTPSITLYDTVSGGIGLSRKAYDRMPEILLAARELIMSCGCQDGCPSCIGPAGENGYAGKQETLALLNRMV
jgi:DEAD/DEAH box helicase domain-containing protein